MHELSVAESIINLIYSSVDSKYLNRVTKVNLKFGELNNINRDSLEFGYSCLIENSDLKNSKLVFQNIEPTIKCCICDKQSIIKNILMICPECGSMDIELISGNELEITEIELTDQELYCQ